MFARDVQSRDLAEAVRLPPDNVNAWETDDRLQCFPEPAAQPRANRLRAEFIEMSSLRLTSERVQRLCGVG